MAERIQYPSVTPVCAPDGRYLGRWMFVGWDLQDRPEFRWLQSAPMSQLDHEAVEERLRVLLEDGK